MRQLFPAVGRRVVPLPSGTYLAVERVGQVRVVSLYPSELPLVAVEQRQVLLLAGSAGIVPVGEPAGAPGQQEELGRQEGTKEEGGHRGHGKGGRTRVRDGEAGQGAGERHAAVRYGAELGKWES